MFLSKAMLMSSELNTLSLWHKKQHGTSEPRRSFCEWVLWSIYMVHVTGETQDGWQWHGTGPGSMINGTWE